MYDIKRIRRDFDEVLKGVQRRGGGDFGLLRIKELEEKRRGILIDLEEKRARQNSFSREIPVKKRAGEDVTELLEYLKELSTQISTEEALLKEVEEEMNELLFFVPNIPQEEVPVGNDDADNKVLRKWGEPTRFAFEPKAHWELGVERDFLDFERGAKVTGSRFTFVKGKAARLERALFNYFLDFHTDSGKYMEMNTPVLANRDSMTGTGQLPKFEEDMYHIASDDLFLIPTAEVTLTNYLKDEIYSHEDLPIYMTSYTRCFRREAGSAGRDTRGIIRQHEFGKVELVKYVLPEESEAEHQDMVSDVERLLQSLELPYQVVLLCTGDLGFSSSKTYDIEVWFPSNGGYREISSISNFHDFQARRAGLRYRDSNGKVQFMHTLNGSGIPTGRTLAAILENNQQENGKVRIPKVLVPYMGGLEEI